MTFKYTFILLLTIIWMTTIKADKVVNRLYQKPKDEDEVKKDPKNLSPIVWVVLGAASIAVLGGCVYVWVKMCRDAFCEKRKRKNNLPPLAVTENDGLSAAERLALEQNQHRA